MRSNTIIGAIAGTAVLAAAGVASAEIRPAEVQGVKIGATRAQVERKLGRPTNEGSGFGYYHMYYKRFGVSYLFRGKTRPVYEIAIDPGSRERTPQGVGLGSPLRAVKRIPGVDCRDEKTTGECIVRYKNKHSTAFQITRGEVYTITVY